MLLTLVNIVELEYVMVHRAVLQAEQIGFRHLPISQADILEAGQK